MERIFYLFSSLHCLPLSCLGDVFHTDGDGVVEENPGHVGVQKHVEVFLGLQVGTGCCVALAIAARKSICLLIYHDFGSLYRREYKPLILSLLKSSQTYR